LKTKTRIKSKHLFCLDKNIPELISKKNKTGITEGKKENKTRTYSQTKHKIRIKFEQFNYSLIIKEWLAPVLVVI